MARSFMFLCLMKESHELDMIAKRRQAQHIRNLPLLSHSDEFVKTYRLNEDLICELERELRPLLPGVRRQRKGLSNRFKILCTLSFLANGSYQKNVGGNLRTYTSQSSVSRCIHQVIEAMNHVAFVKKYIRFPQNSHERQTLKERFYEKFQIPGVIGCIDGSLVAMVRPNANEERYYCRKGYHARNVMLITDADLNILHVDASYGGATHDSFIFNYSSIKENLEQCTNSGDIVHLLGDSGYPQRAYLMTPILGAADNTPEAHYNKLHGTARNSVERTIGILKGRFRCLLVHRVLHYHPDIVAKIVVACSVLHNICNRAGLPAPALSEEELNNERNLVSQVQRRLQMHNVSENELMIGRHARNELVNSLWRNRS